MPTESITLNRAIVAAFGLLYWLGVIVQARRVRRHIGRSPNVRPRGKKEKVLWVGWLFVVVSWLALPWLSRDNGGLLWTRTFSLPVYPLSLLSGTTMMAAGYALTLWCYAAMGDAWRMGVNRHESTHLVTNGPYGFMRHPIYLAQLIMVAAIVVLLPSLLALATLAVHFVCVLIKAADEEAHLRNQLGPGYESYRARIGWFPALFRRKASPSPLHPLDNDSLKSVEPPTR